MVIALTAGMNIKTTPNLTLLGAGPDTGNQGVTALCYSLLEGLTRRNMGPLTVYDHGRHRREDCISLAGRNVHFRRLGAINGRRYYRPNNLWHMRAAARAGGLWSDSARTLCRARAVLDVSGGDSFSEIYGVQRFRTVTLAKRIALDAGRPLILLPQTYGPFRTAGATEIARHIVRGAAAAWARDEASFKQLQLLLGDDFDPDRHHSGVDMAFGLPASPPLRPLPATISGWLEETVRTHPLIGFNVSGLLYDDQDAARDRFDLRSDYRAAVLRVLGMLLTHTDARIVLVPHVVVGRPGTECDLAASKSVLRALGPCGERVQVLDGGMNAAELKWIIGRTDWFCGSRMHATIAGLSSGVPTMALAYSMKTQGVFETCAQGDQVADLRHCEERELADRVVSSWRARQSTRQSLLNALPGLRSRVERQMDAIADAIRQSGDGPMVHSS